MVVKKISDLRRAVVLFVAVALGFSGTFASTEKSLLVYFCDGSQTIVRIDSSLSIGFSGDTMEIRNNETLYSYLIENVDYCQIAESRKDIQTDISPVMQEVDTFSFIQDGIVLSGCMPGSVITVYAPDGSIISTCKIDREDKNVVKLPCNQTVMVRYATPAGQKTLKIRKS